jgi:hypothetical protein
MVALRNIIAITTIIMRSSMLPLSIFTSVIPAILRIGRHKRSNACGEKCRKPPLQISSTPLKKTKIMLIMIMKPLEAINKTANESGRKTPNKKQNSFIRKPPIIRKAILNPTDNSSFSVLLIVSILNSLTKMNPGTKV